MSKLTLEQFSGQDSGDNFRQRTDTKTKENHFIIARLCTGPYLICKIKRALGHEFPTCTEGKTRQKSYPSRPVM